MRCLAVMTVASVLFFSSAAPVVAVNGRDVMRYLGCGWSDGYHSQHAPPARCGRSMWVKVGWEYTANQVTTVGPPAISMPPSDRRAVTSSRGVERPPLPFPLRPSDGRLLPETVSAGPETPRAILVNEMDGGQFSWPQRSAPKRWPRPNPSKQAISTSLPRIALPSVSLPKFEIPWPAPNQSAPALMAPTLPSASPDLLPVQSITRISVEPSSGPSSALKERAPSQPAFRFPRRD